MEDYYGILELAPGASGEEIKANYRRLAMKWHPDRNGGSAEAENRFKLISEAYSVLSNEDSRRDYDSRRSFAGSAAGQGGNWSGYGGRSRTFTAEEAAWLFMNEMYALAMELTMQNVGWRDIAAELGRRGCPEAVAADIARKIETRRKAMIRANAKPYFVRSALSWAGGLMVFVVFGGVGLGLLGFLGLLLSLSGLWNLARALWFLATGRAPSA